MQGWFNKEAKKNKKKIPFDSVPRNKMSESRSFSNLWCTAGQIVEIKADLASAQLNNLLHGTLVQIVIHRLPSRHWPVLYVWATLTSNPHVWPTPTTALVVCNTQLRLSRSRSTNAISVLHTLPLSIDQINESTEGNMSVLMWNLSIQRCWQNCFNLQEYQQVWRESSRKKWVQGI